MLVNSYNNLLVSSWINCMLFMLELVLAVRYFQHSSRPLLHRAGIGAMIASDTLCTFTICAKSIWRVISAILLLGIVVQLAFSYASAVLILATGSPYGWAMLAARIGAISCAVVDSMIAATLLYTFIRMDTTSAFRASTHNLLRRVIALFFSSGVIVASTTLLSTILLLNGKSAYLLFFYSQGRVYALTILGNFAVGVPAQHTPTTTPKLNTITGAGFPVKHTSADYQAVITCDRARHNHQTNSDCSAIQHNKFTVHLTSAARPVV
ncbi:hypothetical protein B0H13DRAFT_2139061 [Mycena leptocephala]|nr:hypothetical protein B0H13DRAFT_2139061 [Mycena leptocephala]